jgi:hypothetical protein
MLPTTHDDLLLFTSLEYSTYVAAEWLRQILQIEFYHHEAPDVSDGLLADRSLCAGRGECGTRLPACPANCLYAVIGGAAISRRVRDARSHP